MGQRSSRKGTAIGIVGAAVIVWNYVAFGWLAAPAMVGVEFTVVVFISLGFIIIRGGTKPKK